MESGFFRSSEIKISGSLGLCKINHISSPATCTRKPWAKHRKECSQKNTNKGKENLKREFLFLTYGKDKVSILDRSFSPKVCSLYSSCINYFCLQCEKYTWIDKIQTVPTHWINNEEERQSASKSYITNSYWFIQSLLYSLQNHSNKYVHIQYDILFILMGLFSHQSM